MSQFKWIAANLTGQSGECRLLIREVTRLGETIRDPRVGQFHAGPSDPRLDLGTTAPADPRRRFQLGPTDPRVAMLFRKAKGFVVSPNDPRLKLFRISSVRDPRINERLLMLAQQGAIR